MNIWKRNSNQCTSQAKCLSVGVLICVSLWCAVSPKQLAAQSRMVAGLEDRPNLPDAPLPQSTAQNQQIPNGVELGTSSIIGRIEDSSGAAVVGAQVTVCSIASKPLYSMVSSALGEFSFYKMPAGRYFLTAANSGFQTFQSAEILLGPAQDLTLPAFSLHIAEADSTITVRPDEVVAAEQIRALEKQRFLGVIPNFYTSYVYDSAPMTAKQKFSLAARDRFDPVSFLGVAIAAGIEQKNNKYAGYGDDAAAYGKRFAAKYGDGLTSDFLSHAVFPALFHQDPRYFVQGSGTKESRLVHALSYAVITRGDNGRNVPNYSYFLGDLSSGALSNLYYPHADRGMGLVFTNAAIGIAGKAGGSVLKEFFSKPLTTNVKSAPKP